MGEMEKTTRELNQALDDLCRVSRDLASRGLTAGSGGNVSVRVRGGSSNPDEDTVLITARGARMESLVDADCVAVNRADGRLIIEGSEGSARPSSELPLHLSVYAATDAGAIVHTHSTHAIVMSTQGETLPSIHYGQARFGGEVRVAPYARFGTRELAEVTSQALADRRAVLMRNHGALAIGDTLDEALETADMLEWLARLAFLTASIGGGSTIDAEELDRVADRIRNWDRYEVER